MVHLFVVREKKGIRPSLVVEFHESTTVLVRDALRAGVDAVAGKVCDHALVAGLPLGGHGSAPFGHRRPTRPV